VIERLIMSALSRTAFQSVLVMRTTHAGPAREVQAIWRTRSHASGLDLAFEDADTE
jgi:hypothetical protein